jgi:histidinol-phosphatase (PHP family)
VSASPALVSVHGGHSGQFCSHARDSLEQVVAAYEDRGFAWVGLTEHMPPARVEMLPDEERAAGLDVAGVRDRFAAYFETARVLQQSLQQRASRTQIHVGFEAEAYPDYEPWLEGLIEEFRPDYIVGSVHHVHEIPFDTCLEDYERAAQRAGGLVELYCDYFDAQFAMLQRFRPAVVGHFDLIRLLDPDYPDRWRERRIWERIERNLRLVRELDLILDFNVRALAKGQSEPYISGPILERARELGIAVVPGDDSHGVDGVGLRCEDGIRLLEAAGFSTDWRRPVR